MIAAGKLDRVIRVEKPWVQGGTDAFNAPLDIWVPHGRFWATSYDQRPIEAWQAGQTAATLETVFRLNWTRRAAAITPAMRIIDRGRTYFVTGVSEPEFRRTIQIVATGDANEEEDA